MPERVETSRRFVMGATSTMILLLTAAVSYLIGEGLQPRFYKQDIIAQLRPYVEKVDGEEGLSPEDAADFMLKARSVGSLRGGDFFDRFSTKELERALIIYKGQEKAYQNQ